MLEKLRQIINILYIIVFFTIGVMAQPENYTIAFIGDSGADSGFRQVLQLILNEGADAVLHQGDFDYDDDPAKFETAINDILGENFPYFASAGNHDENELNGYKTNFQNRMNRLGIVVDGDILIKCSIIFNEFHMVFTAPDVSGGGSGHAEYIVSKFSTSEPTWRLSSWHKNMRDMQVGGKGDEAGWPVYERSREMGALIFTGHEHSYSRTHLLASCQNKTVASVADTLSLSEGNTIVVVSGLGGRSIRDQERSGNWWASIYTSDQNANYGALFGVFNYNGVKNLAKFYFKDIDGNIPDEYFVINTLIGDDFGPSEPIELNIYR